LMAGSAECALPTNQNPAQFCVVIFCCAPYGNCRSRKPATRFESGGAWVAARGRGRHPRVRSGAGTSHYTF